MNLALNQALTQFYFVKEIIHTDNPPYRYEPTRPEGVYISFDDSICGNGHRSEFFCDINQIKTMTTDLLGLLSLTDIDRVLQEFPDHPEKWAQIRAERARLS